jgi:hypothetical protein
MSECRSIQALEEFCLRHYQALCEHLGIQVKRLPSDSTKSRPLTPIGQMPRV